MPFVRRARGGGRGTPGAGQRSPPSLYALFSPASSGISSASSPTGHPAALRPRREWLGARPVPMSPSSGLENRWTLSLVGFKEEAALALPVPPLPGGRGSPVRARAGTSGSERAWAWAGGAAQRPSPSGPGPQPVVPPVPRALSARAGTLRVAEAQEEEAAVPTRGSWGCPEPLVPDRSRFSAELFPSALRLPPAVDPGAGTHGTSGHPRTRQDLPGAAPRGARVTRVRRTGCVSPGAARSPARRRARFPRPSWPAPGSATASAPLPEQLVKYCTFEARRYCPESPSLWKTSLPFPSLPGGAGGFIYTFGICWLVIYLLGEVSGKASQTFSF